MDTGGLCGCQTTQPTHDNLGSQVEFDATVQELEKPESKLARSYNVTCGASCTYPILGLGALLALSLFQHGANPHINHQDNGRKTVLLFFNLLFQ